MITLRFKAVRRDAVNVLQMSLRSALNQPVSWNGPVVPRRRTQVLASKRGRKQQPGSASHLSLSLPLSSFHVSLTPAFRYVPLRAIYSSPGPASPNRHADSWRLNIACVHLKDALGEKRIGDKKAPAPLLRCLTYLKQNATSTGAKFRHVTFFFPLLIMQFFSRNNKTFWNNN